MKPFFLVYKMKLVDLSHIRTNGGTQSRVELSQEVVSEYSEAFKSGAKFPPVIVFFDGVDHWLADGFHRFFGAKDAGISEIHAEVIQGTKRDAVLYSLKANATHGLKRTNADKRKAVMTMLADPEWSGWSDRKVAEVCGVGHPLVASIRNPEVAVKQQENRIASAVKKSSGVESDSTTLPNSLQEQQDKPASSNAKSLQEVESEAPADYSELDAANDQISELQADLVVARMGDVTEEDKQQAAGLIAELQAEVKTLSATLAVVKLSRDSLMEERAQMLRQMKAQRAEIDRLKSKN